MAIEEACPTDRRETDLTLNQLFNSNTTSNVEISLGNIKFTFKRIIDGLHPLPFPLVSRLPLLHMLVLALSLTVPLDDVMISARVVRHERWSAS